MGRGCKGHLWAPQRGSCFLLQQPLHHGQKHQSASQVWLKSPGAVAQGWECSSARQNHLLSRPNRRQWGEGLRAEEATEDRAGLSSGVQAKRPGHIQLIRSGTKIKAKAQHNYMFSSL